MSVTMRNMNETLIQEMKKSILMPPVMQPTLSEGKIKLLEMIKSWALEGKAEFDSPWDRRPEDIQTLNTRHPEKFEDVTILYYKPARRTRKDWTSSWNEVFGDPPVKGFLEIVENKTGHMLNMTEGEYNLWKDMPEELKNKLIKMCPQKAEVVERLRSWARKPTSQEHTNPETGGGSSTAQNEPPPNHQGLPVGGDHQVHNVQVNGSVADNEPAEHINPETGGGSSTAQNEPPPNHQSLPVGGDHQVHNLQVIRSLNQAGNYAPESSDVESGTLSTQADNEPAPDKCGNEIVFTGVGQIISIALGVISVKNSSGKMTIEAKIFLYFLIGFIFVSIISLPYGLCLSGGGGNGRRSIVARAVNTVSYVAIGMAVVTAAGLQLPNQVMVWVIPLVWGIIAPAIVCCAIKQ